MKHFITKRLKPLLVITIFVSAVVSFVQHHDLAQRLEYIAYDWQLALARKDKAPPADVKIVLIDDVTLQAMDPVVGRWPWPRNVFGDIIDFIALGEPKAIIFDILFSESEGQSDESRLSEPRIFEASKTAGMVYHAMLLMSDSSDSANVTINPMPPLLAQQHAVTLPPSLTNSFNAGDKLIQTYNNFLIPVDGLDQAAAGLGVVSVQKDSDGVLRRMSPFFQYQEKFYPALSTAALLLSQDPSTPSRLSNTDLATIPLTPKNNVLVNEYAFDGYSMSALLAAKAKLENGDVENLPVDPAEFTGKYVFIGASAIGLHDLKTTPLIKNAPGVYMHASLLGNFLENDFLNPPQDVFTYTSILLSALITALLVLGSKRLLLQLVIPALLIIAYIGLVAWQFYQNQVMVMVTPTLAILLSWASCYSFLLFTEEKEKNQIRKMFSQYVSPAALTVMVDDFQNYAGAGKGIKETVTVLFADVRGFTSLSEHLPPEQVVEILNYYFSKMTEAIHTHNGTIDKFIGDAIMAIWGAPIKSNTHAIDAVKAAMDMMEKLKEVNTWLAGKNLPPIKIGIGINTGDAILGSVGSEQKADYTVIGDTVNLASRLEGVTKLYCCDIVISEFTQKALNDRIPSQVVDMIKVKGKAKAIKIYSPLVTDAQASRTKAYELHCLSELSHEAFTHYLNKRWDLAINAYKKIPNENLRKKFINRCEHFRLSPPPKDWDGTTTMTTK